MPIIKTHNQSFRWLAAELLVVVLGILIAFQIEEFRSERKDRIEEENGEANKTGVSTGQLSTQSKTEIEA